LAEATSTQVSALGESVETSFVELREVAGELATFMVTGGIPTPRLTELREQVATADGLIAVTPVFNASFSGLFKMFFDAVDPDSLTGTPVLVAATAGTSRHSLVLDHAMRPLFAHLRAVVVPTGVFAATEDFGSHGLAERITRAAAQLAAAVLSHGEYAVGGFAPDLAARPRRTSGTPVEADVTPFGDLLRGHSGSGQG
ncbi:CE1759 family FMN reductase, partial [Nocardioides furvisabuli]